MYAYWDLPGGAVDGTHQGLQTVEDYADTESDLSVINRINDQTIATVRHWLGQSVINCSFITI